MDIYGYSGVNNLYPYDRSNDLAKQLFTQQSLPGSMNFNREGHDMPAPSGSPWNPQGVPWGMPSPPQLVQFTGQNGPLQQNMQCVPISQTTPFIQPYPTPMTPNLPTTNLGMPMQSFQSSISMPCKRKSLDPEPVIPPKQLITEEKMAAHFSGLNISGNYEEFSPPAQECMEIMQDANSNDVPILEKLKGHKIVLSDELKKLREEPLLPASLIERLEKPCMSLVVWKPKEEIINGKKDSKKKHGSDDDILREGTSKRRNGVLVPKLPEPASSVMDVEM